MAIINKLYEKRKREREREREREVFKYKVNSLCKRRIGTKKSDYTERLCKL